MPSSLIFIGLGLLALWVVLQVTEAVVGGLLWIVLVAALIVLAIGVVRHFSSRTGGRTRTPV